MNETGAVTQQAANWFDNFLLYPLGLAFLGLIPVIILLYLLKLRRTEVVISSTLLWMKSLQDLTANAPFQRLRKNLLMFLQILAVAAMVFAAARPYYKAEGRAGRTLCLLIDRSASMQCIEQDGRTRLDQAKDDALRLINEMQKDDKTMLVSFARKAEVLCELTNDRSRLRAAVRGIKPSDGRTRIRDAVLVAHSLQQSQGGAGGAGPDGAPVEGGAPGLDIVVITDGKIRDLEEVGTRMGDFTYLQAGASSDNAGIAAFSVRDPVPGVSAEQQSFLLLHNASPEALVATVTLSFNEEAMALEEVNVPPGEDYELLFTHPELGEGVLTATLDHEDALAVDNTANLAIQPPADLDVLLVTEPDSASGFFLQRVLLPDPRVELSTVSPANFMVSDEYDLTVFDSYSPDELPGGTLVFINSVPPLPGVAAGGEVENPPVIALDSEHPVMRFGVNPSNVSIASALKLVVPGDARSIVSTTGSPLIADVSRGGQQVLVIAFDIAKTDWFLNLSYPLFFQNLLAWVPRAALVSDNSVAVGEPLPILPDAEHDTAVVERPDGSSETVELDPSRPTYYAATEKAGLYRVRKGEKETVFAVNVLDKTETSVTPAESINIGRRRVEAKRGRVRQNVELWRWLVAAALAVLTLEWAIYSRRAWF